MLQRQSWQVLPQLDIETITAHFSYHLFCVCSLYYNANLIMVQISLYLLEVATLVAMHVGIMIMSMIPVIICYTISCMTCIAKCIIFIVIMMNIIIFILHMQLLGLCKNE